MEKIKIVFSWQKVIFVILLMALLGVPAPIEAGMARTTTLDLTTSSTSSSKDQGWTWDASGRTLILEGARIQTKDGDGIKLPANSTIVLKGDNVIKAGIADLGEESHGIYSLGSLTIRGDGKLSSYGSDCYMGGNGIFVYPPSYNSDTKLTIESGTILAKGGNSKYQGQDNCFNNGIYVSGDLTIEGGNITATVGGGKYENGVGIQLRPGNLRINGGSINASRIEGDTLYLKGGILKAAASLSYEKAIFLRGQYFFDKGMRIEAGSMDSSHITIAEGQLAMPAESNITINGKNVKFDAYNIDGSTYFKLRDLAYVLNNTDAKFNIGWDQATKAISIESKKSYKAVGGEMAQGDGKNKNARVAKALLYINNKKAELSAYNINGNTYFKLRDLGNELNFNVSWDASKKQILINTKETYSQDESLKELLIGNYWDNGGVTTGGHGIYQFFSDGTFLITGAHWQNSGIYELRGASLIIHGVSYPYSASAGVFGAGLQQEVQGMFLTYNAFTRVDKSEFDKLLKQYNRSQP